jgi:hypothetical protein
MYTSPTPNATTDSLVRQIAILQEWMLVVHYYEESHWLAPAVSFPHLCKSPVGQDALRRAATVTWHSGFPAVSIWVNRKVLAKVEPATRASGVTRTDRPFRLPPAPDFA